MERPAKPTPDYPLFAHNSGYWAKKHQGKTIYFGPWADPQAALERYNAWLTGEPVKANRGGNGKPRPDFPLYKHATGQWAKRVRGKVHYFGSDPNAALEKWTKQKDDLLAGRVPVDGTGLTVGKLCNLFLASKWKLVESRELKAASYHDYNLITDRIAKVFGETRLVASLGPADFEKLRADFATTHTVFSLCADITRSRVVFKFAYDAGLIDRPVRYGPGFKKPSRKTLRIHRQNNGKRMFAADEIRQILDNASVPIRAMTYLGVNCGLGNNDCAKLTVKNLDLDGGWLDFGRPKTGIPRRCPLWPETVEAVKAALAARPEPKDLAHKDRVFVTKRGYAWEREEMIHSCSIGKEFGRLTHALGIHRKGTGFYALRHTFYTIGRKADKDTAKAIMGHADDPDDIGETHYNEEGPADAQLRAVTDYVRAWLFPAKVESAIGQVKPADAAVPPAAKTGN